MKRKVNLVGKNTLTVSLPRIWTVDEDIEKGDDLSVSYSDGKIIFEKQDSTLHKKAASLHIDGYGGYTRISQTIAHLYRMGYRNLVVNYSKLDLPQPKGEVYPFRSNPYLRNLKNVLTRLISRFAGAEIVSQSSVKTDIDFLLKGDEVDLPKTEKRVFFLFKEALRDLLESIGPNFSKFDEVAYDHHDNITKFINYYLRAIHSSSLTSDEKRFGFAFFMHLDLLSDKLRHVSAAILNNGCSPRCKKIISEIFSHFFSQFSLLDDPSKVTEVVTWKHKIKKRIIDAPLTAAELRVIGPADFFLDSIHVFFHYGIAKQFAKDGGKKIL